MAKIEREFQEIRALDKAFPAEYETGRALLRKAGELVDRKPEKALGLVLEAKQRFVDERRVLLRLEQAIKLSAVAADDVAEVRSEVRSLLRHGDFEEAAKRVEQLELRSRALLGEELYQYLLIASPSEEVVVGKPCTVTMVLRNDGPQALSLRALEGRSSRANVKIFQDFRGSIDPGESRPVPMNVLAGTGGDITVDLSGELEIAQGRFRFQKQVSIRTVDAPLPSASQPAPATTGPVAAAPPVKRVGGGRPQGPSISFDLAQMMRTGQPGEWLEILAGHVASRAPLSFEKLGDEVKDFPAEEGYHNFLLSTFLIGQEDALDWQKWLTGGGILGNEYASRCFALMFALATGKDRSFPLEHDGSIGTSSRDYLIGSLNLASGLTREMARQDAKEWAITLPVEGGKRKIKVVRKVVKPEGGRPYSEFHWD